MEQKVGRFLTRREVVHHINGIQNDNRIDNLRAATKTQNMLNLAEPRGVSWNAKNKSWIARYNTKYLGSYKTKDEALHVRRPCGAGPVGLLGRLADVPGVADRLYRTSLEIELLALVIRRRSVDGRLAYPGAWI